MKISLCAVTSCVTGAASAITGTNNCPAGSLYCKTDFAADEGDGIKSCETSCIPTADVACCDTNDCNTAIETAAGTNCFVCFDETGCDTTSAVSPCAVASPTHCKATFVNGVAVRKECATSCTGTDSIACVTVAYAAYLTATTLKTCLQCVNTVGSPNACDDVEGTACAGVSASCYTEFNLITGKVTEKGCSSYLSEASDDTDYCSSDDCNTRTGLYSCMVCANGEDCADTTEGTFCYPFAEDYCKTEYNSSKIAIKKSCSRECEPDEFTSCCVDENDCNTSIEPLLCYQCSNELECAHAVDMGSIPCEGADQTVCQSVYHADSHGVAMWKFCAKAAECVAGTSNGTTITCCEEDECNSGFRFASNLLFSFILPAILLAFKKF